VEESLKEIKDGTNAALTNMSEQSKKVDDSINNLSQVLEELEKNDKERDSDFNDMKREIDTLQTTVSKVCHQAK
jgi:peroxin-14